jgi:NAD(P)-dependent dehydrogenase (short-subunit alcohol dehydrogenase family)
MDNPVIIVTGASRGLGAAIARSIDQYGGSVVANARSAQAVHELVEEIRGKGGQALAFPGDVSQAAVCEALIQKTIQEFGRLDGLVNNAGIIEPIARVADAALQEWQDNFAINYFGPLILAQKALPYLRQRHGRIINISSGSSTSAMTAWGAYSTAKAALDHLTRILAQEEPAVTALAVRPGIVDTQMQATIRAKGKAAMAQANFNRLNGLFEQGKLVPPEQSGRAIACQALFAPQAWSGETLMWDEPRVMELVESAQKP